MNDELYPITGKYQTHSESALCIKIDDEYLWFPFTTIEHDEPLINYDRGDKITFDVQAWLLIEKGLENLVDV